MSIAVTERPAGETPAPSPKGGSNLYAACIGILNDVLPLVRDESRELDEEIAAASRRLAVIKRAAGAVHPLQHAADEGVRLAERALNEAAIKCERVFAEVAKRSGYPNCKYVHDRNSVRDTPELLAAEAEVAAAKRSLFAAQTDRDVVRGLLPAHLLMRLDAALADLNGRLDRLRLQRAILSMPSVLREQLAARVGEGQ